MSDAVSAGLLGKNHVGGAGRTTYLFHIILTIEEAFKGLLMRLMSVPVCLIPMGRSMSH